MTGVAVAGLTTTVFPVARAVTIERTAKWNGKFHGLMMPMTPSGLRYTRFSLFGTIDGLISPSIRKGNVAASLMMAIDAANSLSALMRVLPDSFTSQSTIKSLLSIVSWANFSINSRRACGSMSAQSD